MLSREELKEAVTRIFDSIREDKECAGQCDCDGIHSCSISKCPFDGSNMYCFDEESIDNVFNSLEYIEKWAQEHPPITYEQKYKEVFGVEPKTRGQTYICPGNAGWFNVVNCVGPCAKCKEEFWHSEYKEPKPDKEEDSR